MRIKNDADFLLTLMCYDVVRYKINLHRNAYKLYYFEIKNNPTTLG